MNYTELNKVIKFYLCHYEEIRSRENYKWEAVMAFQNAAPMRAEAELFPVTLREGLKKAGNLLDSGYYFPRTALSMLLSRDPEAVRLMFEDLFCEEDALFDRVTVFMMKARELRRKYFTQTELPADDQDEHAVSVYLSFHDPAHYYIYKYSIFRKTAQLLDYRYVPQRSDARNLSEFYRFCDQIREHLLATPELLRREEERRARYPEADPAYRLLTEDILICAATYYTAPELFSERGEAEEMERFRLTPVQKNLPLEAVPFYDAVEIAQYEAQLRESGLQFLLSQERLRVRSYRLSARKQPELLSAGTARGEGYDLLSYDRRGEELHIAVKVTTGPENESFRISEAERLRSARDAEHYRLYRLYDFDRETGRGRCSVYRGDLSSFCLNPESYRVMF